jgi:hypothetical protein
MSVMKNGGRDGRDQLDVDSCATCARSWRATRLGHLRAEKVTSPWSADHKNATATIAIRNRAAIIFESGKEQQSFQGVSLLTKE